MTRQIFDKEVQLRLGDSLHAKLTEQANREGVGVASWARTAILSSLSRRLPAEVPQLTGQKKLSIRLRSSDHNRLVAAAAAHGRDLSGFLRGLLALAAGRKGAKK